MEETSISKRLDELEKSVGKPESEHTKPLFEIVEALNKQLLELRIKIENMEEKDKKYDYTD